MMGTIQERLQERGGLTVEEQIENIIVFISTCGLRNQKRRVYSLVLSYGAAVEEKRT